MTEPITSELRQLSDRIKSLERRIIKDEYDQMKQDGMTYDCAVEELAKRHFRSVSAINHIIYPRGKKMP